MFSFNENDCVGNQLMNWSQFLCVISSLFIDYMQYTFFLIFPYLLLLLFISFIFIFVIII